MCSLTNAWRSEVDGRLKFADVSGVLSDLFILRGAPEHICSDNGAEFVAKAPQNWIAAMGAKTAYIAPGRPRENGFIERFNARLRDELLDGEILYTLREAKVVIEGWRYDSNTQRPHGSLGCKPPVPGQKCSPCLRRAGRFAIPTNCGARASPSGEP